MDPAEVARLSEADLRLDNDMLFLSLPLYQRNNPGVRRRHLDEIRRIRSEYMANMQEMEKERNRRLHLENLRSKIDSEAAVFLQQKEDCIQLINSLREGYAYSNVDVVLIVLRDLLEAHLERMANVDATLKSLLAEAQHEGMFAGLNVYDPQFFSVAYNDIALELQEVLSSIPNINYSEVEDLVETILATLISLGNDVEIEIQLEEEAGIIGEARTLINQGVDAQEVIMRLVQQGHTEDAAEIAVTEVLFGGR